MELSIEIVPATVDDVVGISDVQKESWLATYPNEEHNITREDILSEDYYDKDALEQRQAAIADPNSSFRFWVAKSDGKVVGYCCVEKLPDSNKIKSLFIIPAFQGMGIGRRLLDQAFGFLDMAKPTTLTVAIYTEQAIRFYEKFGFVRGRVLEHNPDGPFESGHEIPEMEMTKQGTA